MTRSVDVVVVGGDAAAVAATIEAVSSGLRVLVVIRPRRSGFARRLRQAMGTVTSSPPHVTVLTGAEVACVDGVKTIEAVVVRQLRTGRLTGVNASALLAFGERCETGHIAELDLQVSAQAAERLQATSADDAPPVWARSPRSRPRYSR